MPCGFVHAQTCEPAHAQMLMPSCLVAAPAQVATIWNEVLVQQAADGHNAAAMQRLVNFDLRHTAASSGISKPVEPVTAEQSPGVAAAAAVYNSGNGPPPGTCWLVAGVLQNSFTHPRPVCCSSWDKQTSSWRITKMAWLMVISSCCMCAGGMWMCYKLLLACCFSLVLALSAPSAAVQWQQQQGPVGLHH